MLKAVIMAGGEGTRLRPLTSTRPKPMISVVGKPVMEHVIELLKLHGLKELEATLHYRAEMIQDYFEDGSRFGVEISYSREETPLGTAGSVKAIEDRLDGTFLVISGDLLTDFDLSKIMHLHKKRGALVTIGLTRVPNPLQYGITMVNTDGWVERFLEKPSWGEVFTDTINAGIYLIEPEALRPLGKGEVYDFSKDLFPMLLKNKEPILGCLLEGYWCDIGDIQQYMQANYDALLGRVKLKIPGREVEEGLWIGEGAEIREGAVIERPAYIGRDCLIKRSFVGRLSVIADGVTVYERATIKRSIVLNRAIIEPGAELIGCIVGERCTIGSHASIYDLAIIGDDSSVGKGAVVNTNIRIWPRKVIDEGSTLSEDLRWGERWTKELFGPWGLSGRVNIDYTPEFTAKLGAAVGTLFGKGRQVAVARDTSRCSRMVESALTAGLCSTGVDVHNLRVSPTPVVRLYVRKHGLAGGVFTKVTRLDPISVNIQIFDSSGINLDRNCEKKIQDILSKEDVQRAAYDEIGTLVHPAGFEEDYLKSLEHFVDSEIISRARLRVVVDCSNGAGSILIPRLLSNLGCEIIPLNTKFDGSVKPNTHDESKETFAEISEKIREFHAEIGVIFDTDAERIVIFDESGRALSGDTALALMAKVLLKECGGGRVAVPVTASQAIEAISILYGGSVVRSKFGAYHILKAAQTAGVVLGGDGHGGFVFPNFHGGYDGIAALVKLLEAMAKRMQSLSNMMKDIPTFTKVEVEAACPWQHKGKVMKALIEGAEGSRIDTTDGVKIFHSDGWVAMIPSSEKPVIVLCAEAKNKDTAEALVSKYKAKISELASTP
ncbi:MAG: sugar phosphate nucleotidyltransferase [Candidatus Bathyarchaeia archaeon]